LRSGLPAAALLALALAEGACLAGCAGTPRPPAAEAFRHQEEGVRAATKARARGDLHAAITAQQRALVAARSVEDQEGIALRILDLAALHRAAGAPAEALAALDELLAEPPPLPYPGRWRAAAARLTGLLALDGGDAARGAQWAERALDLCLAAQCPDQGAIINLQARAAFLAGDPDGAIRLARRALPLNRAAKDEEEVANSSRIAADAHLAAGRHGAAASGYAAALAIDKKLGLDAKILTDLVGLGKAARNADRPHEARDWFERARAVALASGDEPGATDLEALITSLPTPSP